MKRKSKKGSKTVSQWKKLCWKVFSEWIRERDSVRLSPNGEREIYCFTCKNRISFKQAQAGHFQPGRYPVFLFDERQVNAQCKKCNSKRPFGLGGNKEMYTLNMIRDYGEEEVRKMLQNKNNFGQWKTHELEEIYLKYKSKLYEFNETKIHNLNKRI